MVLAKEWFAFPPRSRLNLNSMASVTCQGCGASQQWDGAQTAPICNQCGQQIAFPRATVMGLPAGPKPQMEGPPPFAGAGLPAPAATVGDAIDLPAPVAAPRGNPIDLPAPVAAPRGNPIDLPAPVAAPRGNPIDLPAPVAAPRGNPIDLPAPVAAPRGNPIDLPAPVRANLQDGVDLPSPVGAKPTASLDLLTPVGPKPTTSLDLLTPVGAKPNSMPPPFPGQKAGGTNLPAPKGFFDDVPAPQSLGSSGATQKLDLPAPKGFFDDIPAPVDAVPIGASTRQKLDLPAPKGFFDDIPAPVDAAPIGTSTNQPAAPMKLSLDLPEPAAETDHTPLKLDLGSSQDLQPELGTNTSRMGTFGEVTLDQNEATPQGPTNSDIGLAADLPNRQPTATTEHATRATTTPPAKKNAPKKRLPNRMKAILAVTVLVFGAASTGGFLLYQQRAAKEQIRNKISRLLTQTRNEMRMDKPQHWERAAAKAQAVLEIDANHPDALGLLVQAQLAGYYDEGTKFQSRQKLAIQTLRKINENSIDGPEIKKADALHSLVEGRAKLAVETLSKYVKQNPEDFDAFLYLGWAETAMQNPKAAQKAFTKALTPTPNRIPALYGLGKALVDTGSTKEARKAFRTVIDKTRDDPNLSDHIGALVGSAQLVRAESFTARENRLREILNRKDVEELLTETDEEKQRVDPRAVSLAFSLAGNHALRAGRIEEAKQRYDSAERLNPNNLGARIGRAKAALKEGRQSTAQEILEEILKGHPNHLDARLGLAEVHLAMTNMVGAQEQLELTANHPRMVANSYKLRAHLIQGEIYQTNPKTREKSIKEFEAAREIGGEDDIRPTVALSGVLSQLGRHKEALSLLKPIKSKAERDPALAVTLGLAYRSANEAPQAEEWFRIALARKPRDVEAQFQLGLAIFDQGRTSDAIDTLQRAYETDEAREDVGLRLAIILEESKRDSAAGALYKKLLAGRSPSINVKVRAGRYFVRKGNIAGAAELGDQILSENKHHPGGLFLHGEGLMKEKKPAEAVAVLREAVKAEPAPQYLEGLGRAYEMSGVGNYDNALIAYQRAAELAPKYLAPQLGIARIRIAKHDCPKAIPVLKKILTIESTIAWSHYSLGTCFHKLGQTKQAIRAFQQAIRIAPSLAEAYYQLGRVYYSTSQSKESARNLAKATALAERTEVSDLVERANKQPEWLTEAYRLWGYAEWSHENSRGAVRAWKKYIDRNPKNRAEASDVKRLLLRLQAR